MKVSTPTINAIKYAKKLLPALDKNLHSANEEYMRGSLSHGAFNYVLNRHVNALLAISAVDLKKKIFNEELRDKLSETWIENIDENIGYCLSWACMDLKQYINIDLQEAKKKKEKETYIKNLDKLESHLVEMGFTELNPIWQIRTKPKN